MTRPNKRSGYERYKYFLIFFGIMAILNYWYLILRFWWAILIIGIIVKLVIDDAKKGKQQKSNVRDPSIRIIKPVNVVRNVSMVIAAFRICFSCGQGFPLADQFQHQTCPNCNEVHNLSNNLKLMHYKMIEPILINCHKCNLPGNYEDQFCSDCGTAVDHELRLINALEQKKISNKYDWINNLK